MLPEVALLNIFDFYLVDAHEIEAWNKLARVCRQWRNIVLGSPRRLDLQLYFTARTPCEEYGRHMASLAYVYKESRRLRNVGHGQPLCGT